MRNRKNDDGPILDACSRRTTNLERARWTRVAYESKGFINYDSDAGSRARSDLCARARNRPRIASAPTLPSSRSTNMSTSRQTDRDLRVELPT